MAIIMPSLYEVMPRIYCYLSREPFIRVLVSMTPQDIEADHHDTIQVTCCAFRTYYNKQTEKFSVHPDNIEDENWIELPWDEWCSVDNPPTENTLGVQMTNFAMKVFGEDAV